MYKSLIRLLVILLFTKSVNAQLFIDKKYVTKNSMVKINPYKLIKSTQPYYHQYKARIGTDSIILNFNYLQTSVRDQWSYTGSLVYKNQNVEIFTTVEECVNNKKLKLYIDGSWYNASKSDYQFTEFYGEILNNQIKGYFFDTSSRKKLYLTFEEIKTNVKFSEVNLSETFNTKPDPDAFDLTNHRVRYQQMHISFEGNAKLTNLIEKRINESIRSRYDTLARPNGNVITISNAKKYLTPHKFYLTNEYGRKQSGNCNTVSVIHNTNKFLVLEYYSVWHSLYMYSDAFKGFNIIDVKTNTFITPEKDIFIENYAQKLDQIIKYFYGNAEGHNVDFGYITEEGMIFLTYGNHGWLIEHSFIPLEKCKYLIKPSFYKKYFEIK